MKSNYVGQFSEGCQNQIKAELLSAISKLELNYEEAGEALERALNSRLGDLEDIININKYL